MARNKLFTEPVAVIGLGRFGTACALELARVGHPVTVVEKDPVVAEAFHGRVDKVLVRDATQPAAVTVPAAFVTMVLVSLATQRRLPAHVSRTMVRLHTPEAVELDRGPYPP